MPEEADAAVRQLPSLRLSSLKLKKETGGGCFLFPPELLCQQSVLTKEPAYRGLPMESCWNISDGRLTGGERKGKAEKLMEYLYSFLIGGLICAAVQILLDRTK